MITLTLLHPLQSVPVQSWPFESESVIRIGRSTDNDVILYSAVVSRHHVELRRNGSSWEIVSLGANGTYIDGKRITQMPVVNGMIVRLASSGPKIQIHLEGETPKAGLKTASGKRSSSQKDTPDQAKETLIDASSKNKEEDN
ncbi:MAG TPA: phosphopeptide-binding protein [Cyanobacteria bacterium UBA8803]|nr:phosphopeptide-binding protein [Cyanobacteria bacterium UBA9273]HBL60167.1 phosphopeptide-binding protein [Cyanobacteria bacterium UBA8803]